MKKGKILLHDMRFYAYHGCFEREKIVGTPFSVNVRMEYDTEKSTHSDCVEDALNYQRAYKLISKEMKTTSNLLESVAQRILDTLFSNFAQLEYAEVEVRKLAPPMGGEIGSVSLTLEQYRQQ